MFFYYGPIWNAIKQNSLEKKKKGGGEKMKNVKIDTLRIKSFLHPANEIKLPFNKYSIILIRTTLIGKLIYFLVSKHLLTIILSREKKEKNRDYSKIILQIFPY